MLKNSVPPYTQMQWAIKHFYFFYNREYSGEYLYFVHLVSSFPSQWTFSNDVKQGLMLNTEASNPMNLG